MTDLSNLSNAELLAIVQGGPGTSAGGAPSSEIAAIKQNESSGASDSATGIVNPASGARGAMQVLPSTAANPGYGVRPSDGTPQDDARTGRDIYAALRKKYGSPDLAAIAYNWGPGNTDKWLANGADLSKLPDETLKYAVNFKQQLGDTGDSGGAQQAVVPGVTDNPIPQPSTGPDSSFLTKLGAGVGEGFGNTVLGGQALVGKALDTIGATTPGDWLVNDAQQGKANLASQADAAAGDSGWRTAGNIVGAGVPMLAAGPELLPQIAAGALYGGSQGALNNTGVLPGAVEGAGLGAFGATAGYGAGKLIGAAGTAAQPVIQRIGNTIRGGEASAASRIGGALGDDLDSTIAALDANSNEIIPGSLPTAAEAANNPAIVRMQRAAQNTEAGQAAFPQRQAQNNAARFAAGQAAVGDNLAADADAFTQAQATRIAAGQAELPPVSQAQADIMQTPAYAQAMKAARAGAEGRGSTVFEDQQVPLQNALKTGIDNVAGTPETLDALRAVRGAGADDMFRNANVSVPIDNDQFQALLQKPAFKAAIDSAQKTSDNLGEGSIYTTTQNRAVANLGGSKAAPVTYVSGRGLLYAKGVLDDQINRAMQLGENAKARPLMAVRNELVGAMDAATNGEYAAARAQFAADSAPIDAQAALQKRLNGTVDPLTGAVSPNKLRQTINSVTGEQMKSGIRQADKVTPEMLEQLRALGEQAKTTPTNMAGLNGEGQEYLRQALDERVRGTADTLMRRDANDAASNFSDYLRQKSPSYAQYFDQAATTGADIQSRQALAQALEKLGLAGNNASGDAAITFQGAKGALNQAGPLTGSAQTYATNLLDDLQRATTANAALGAAGSQTAANQQLGAGLLGRFLQGRTSDTAIGAAIGSGSLLTAAAAAAVRTATAKAAARTESAAIDLLLNPKKLARALEQFKGQPQAKQVFIDAIKQKASNAGRAGVRAVQAYEVERTQKRGK